METRPTTDRVKEGLFNVLQFDIEGREGAGSLCRHRPAGHRVSQPGAASTVFVDRRPDAVSLAKENLKLCNLTDRARVVAGDPWSF